MQHSEDTELDTDSDNISDELQQLSALLDLYQNDITIFAKQVFDADLSPKQIEIAEAFQKNVLTTVKGGVGFGKTYVMAVVVWWSLICHDAVKVSIFGPNEANLKTGIFAELQKLHNIMNPLFKEGFKVEATRISRKVNGANCFAEYRLANKDNPDSARGIHAPNNFILVDESTGVDDQIFEVLLNILSDPNPKILLVSNPSKASGFFWRTFNDPDISDDWTKITGKLSDAPHYDPEKAKIQIKNYGGVTSRQHRVMVLGEFPLSDEEGLFSREFIEAAVANTNVVPAETEPRIWGLDPASLGSDGSILCIRHDNKVIAFHEWKNLEPTQLSYAVRDLYEKTPKTQRPAVIAIDAGGLGNGVWSNLRDFGLPVHSAVFNGTPTRRPDLYQNVRAQIYAEAKDWIHSENVSIPSEPKFIEELAITQYSDETGKIKIEDKKSIRKRLKRSPDYADAFCLTFAVSPSRYKSKFSWSKPIEYGNLSSYE